MRVGHKNRHMSSFQIIILSFLSVILLGTILLMLPAATRQPGSASFSDAAFTATSAVCVTGLVLHDTATYWSFFGQLVILLLIQVGGMGVVTAAASIAIFSGRKIGLMQRSTMQEAIAAPHVGGIVRMTGFILKVTLTAELIGTVLLSFVFCREFGPLKGVWYALFHSVSAFCNAGFDLTGVKEPFSSFTSYSASPILNSVVMLLIIIGGIGFFTWDDIGRNGLRFRKYRMQTKVILTVTGILIALPAVYFFFFEFSDMPIVKRIWSSLFQSVTPRTAGFNTVDLTQLSETGQLLTIVLMLTGGSPGSTAGGMKTTTLAVLLSCAMSVFRKKESTHFFRRRVASGTERNAATVALLYVSLFLISGMIISRLENLPILTALFETASAIGTVGLTLGITPSLGIASQMILAVLMFFGRVGGLTLIFAAFSKSGTEHSRYPQEKITVG
ncbi:MAG: potassium transporter TrkG [Oscillospiraceae bacterium]|nr:potassium transporter TrkG [Oscillospiraceae bacterium]